MIRKKDIPFLETAHILDQTMANIVMKQVYCHGQKPGGTVLLSMNQSDVYEQHTAEMLTFILEGINVMSYNNAEKGLSHGHNNKQRIDDAVLLAHRFIREIKNCPDESIVAKGQCFGAGPTSFLGTIHPNINLWIDQSPKTFRDVALRSYEKNLRKRIQKEKNKKDSRQAKIHFYETLKNSAVIKGSIRHALPNYQIDEAIKRNKGNKLFTFNIANEYDYGGDHLVPDSDVDDFTKAVGFISNAYNKLVYIPGGIHVTSWYTNDYTYEGVLDFFDKTELKKNIFCEQL